MKQIIMILSALCAANLAQAQNNPAANPLVWGINAATSPLQVGQSTVTTFSVGNNGADPIPAGGAAFNVSFPPNVTVNQSSLNFDGGAAIFSATWTVIPNSGTYLKINVVGNGIPAATFMGPQVRFDMTVSITGAVAGSAQQQTINAEFDASIAQNLNPGDDNANGPIEVTSALPITLNSFTATLTDRKNARLDWVISKANLFSYFELERSLDGINFSKLKTIDYNGSEAYTSVDNTIRALQDRVYYRLKMVDNDGSYKRSDVVSLYLKATSQEISVFPNPATDAVTLKGLSGAAVLDVYSVDGRLVFSRAFSDIQEAVDISSLVPGSYSLKISDQNGTKTILLIKK